MFYFLLFFRYSMLNAIHTCPRVRTLYTEIRTARMHSTLSFHLFGNKGTFSWVKAPGLSYELFLKTHLPGQGRLFYSSPTVISKWLSERIVSIRLLGFSTSCVYRCPFLSKVNMKKRITHILTHSYTRTHKTAIHHIFLPPEL